jgi:methyltransferase (TIGR00027 family)
MVLVAIEQNFSEDQRIITDALAYPILPTSSRISARIFGLFKHWLIAKTEKKVPGLWGGIMSRKRYIDDKLTEVADRQIEAVVNLGAGFDTRAFRLRASDRVPVWEVDLPQNIDAKRSRIEKLFAPFPAHLTLVPIDFDQQDLATVLATHGFTPDRKTFCIWEGVTQYVTEDGIRATLEYLAKAPSGSRLVFTYTPEDFIDGEVLYGQEYLYKQMLVKDKIWLFGLDPEKVGDFIRDYGWRVLEHLGYDELDELYVTSTGRNLQSMAIERIVFAEKM